MLFYVQDFYAITHAQPALLKVRASCCTCASACVPDETGLLEKVFQAVCSIQLIQKDEKERFSPCF